MSAELTWAIIKNNSSFLIKRNGLVFSTERGNLRNENYFKHNGLVNQKAVDISAGKDKSIVVSFKSTKKSKLRKPGSTYVTRTLKRDFRRVSNTIFNDIITYRPDLKCDALGKLSALVHAAKPVTRKAKKTRRGAAKK
jgi:large subunit ribosomal protein L28e